MSKKLFKTVCLVSFLILIVCAFSACHDHAFGEWQQEKPATCAEVGSVIRTCECGAEERNELPRLSHTFGEWVITALSGCSVEAGFTCGTEGDMLVKRKMIQKARTSVVMCSKEKFSCLMPYTFASLNEVDYLITDSVLSDNFREAADDVKLKVL